MSFLTIIQHFIDLIIILQAVAIIDLADSNGEIAVAELEKEFGADRVIFLIGNVTNAEELAGNMSIYF